MLEEARISTAAKLGATLINSELNDELAIASTARLIAEITEARQPAGLSCLHGQTVLEQAALALSRLIEARGHKGKVHRALGQMADAMGIPETAYGDGTPKPGSGDPAHPFMPATPLAA